jgi:hypothetical protein
MLLDTSKEFEPCGSSGPPGEPSVHEVEDHPLRGAHRVFERLEGDGAAVKRQLAQRPLVRPVNFASPDGEAISKQIKVKRASPFGLPLRRGDVPASRKSKRLNSPHVFVCCSDYTYILSLECCFLPMVAACEGSVERLLRSRGSAQDNFDGDAVAQNQRKCHGQQPNMAHEQEIAHLEVWKQRG